MVPATVLVQTVVFIILTIATVNATLNPKFSIICVANSDMQKVCVKSTEFQI